MYNPTVAASVTDNLLRGDYRKKTPWNSLNAVLYKRIFPGFRISEGLGWFLFHLCWPLMLALIYHLSGKFDDKAFMTANQFFQIQCFVVAGKAMFLLPFWWLFFIKLKHTPLVKKVLIHIFTAILYVISCLSLFYVILTNVLGMDYTGAKLLGDVYNLMLTYFSNFALFHAYNFWLHTQRQMRKERELRELAYQSEIMALKSQIEPHFLFNTLNSISATVPPSLEKTRVLIAQLADTFRYALRVSERDTVPLEEEIAFIKTWLALEKQRLGKRLTVDYFIDEPALSVHIPPLILQPLIENALKHSIGPSIGGGTVIITCRQIGNFVHIGISDTGDGPGDGSLVKNAKGIGLKNTARRIEHFYNEKLTVTEMKNGLCFSFKIPVKL